MAETDLSKVPGWSADHVARLAKSWISSAEQVLAVSVTSGGIQSLAQQLNVSEAEATRLIDLARSALTPTVRAEMSQPFDSDERGMGAMNPRKEGGKAPTNKG
jgi:hypothetical protein